MKKKLWDISFVRVTLITLAGLLILFALLVVMVYYWEISNPEPQGYDCIIVLGCQVKSDGNPSVQLRSRLDKAEEYYRKNPCRIIVTGGQGTNEPAPEGIIMRDCLIADGIPESDILCETEAPNTKANIANSWKMLSEYGCAKPLIITSDYHLKRALAIAGDQGIIAEGAGSPCRPEVGFWLKNHCREALSWLKYWALKYLKLKL